jgi:diguanylate cyclase (GGDEF)-like protein
MNGKVLIVEDDPAIRMLIKRVFEDSGYTISEAVDGPSALPAAREARPDVILLDVGLPGMDGFAVLNALKDDDLVRETPVIMVTAWAEPELVARALDRGAHDYVRKPFDVGELRARVNAAIRAVPAADAVSGLPGRQALVTALERECASAHRLGGHFSVAVIALDAEEVPDAAVHAIGRRLTQRTRRGDIVGRWGYRTFLVIADGSDIGGAGALAEDLRRALADRPVATMETSLRLTASIGVAEFTGGERYEQLLERAAAAVHSAQLGGRNAVRLADAPEPHVRVIR